MSDRALGALGAALAQAGVKSPARPLGAVQRRVERQDAREVVLRDRMGALYEAIDDARQRLTEEQTKIRLWQFEIDHLVTGDLDLIQSAQNTNEFAQAHSLVPVERLPIVPRRYAERETVRAGVFPQSANPVAWEISGTQYTFGGVSVVEYPEWRRALSGVYRTRSGSSYFVSAERHLEKMLDRERDKVRALEHRSARPEKGGET